MKTFITMLQDQSGAAPLEKLESLKFWKHDSLRDNRLVGIQPSLKISGGQLVLTAAARHRAQIRSALLDLDPSLLERLQGGDRLTIVRTGTADIGVSLLRVDELVWAVGAATVVPLGEAIGVQGGPTVEPSTRASHPWPRIDTWVEVSYSGQTSRLRGGNETTMGGYRIAVLRCFEDGLPGTYESVAISRSGMCPHDAAVRSAQLLARPNAGLELTDW